MEEHNKLARDIVNAAYKIHYKLGPGLLETVYEQILVHELSKNNLLLERQRTIPIEYDDIIYDSAFKVDLIVNSKVIVELKSVEQIIPVHKKQLLTYLRLTELRLGLLINFNEVRIKNGITRIVNGL